MSRAEEDFFGFAGQAMRTRQQIEMRARVRATEGPRRRTIHPEDIRATPEPLGKATARRVNARRKR